MIATPVYTALRARLDEEIAENRRTNGLLHDSTYQLMRALSSAVTSGQYAGERAAHNAWKPYEFQPFDSYDHRTVAKAGNDAAAQASAAARERVAVKINEMGAVAFMAAKAAKKRARPKRRRVYR